MPNYFNDSPIENEADDQYGIAPFAAAMAKSIMAMHNPVGTTIAINGEWGSGKSSAINLIRNELAKADDDRLTIVDFKCWWYRGEEALTLAFFQDLNSALKDGLGDKVKDLVPKISRHILQAGPVIGTAVSLATTAGWGGLASGSAAFIKRFFPDAEALEKTFRKLSKALQDNNRRFLIIIDDIDRLAPDEAIAVFRLLKSVGRLPNVMYLVAFDRKLADEAVNARYPSEGPHYLEKIIQASFELPAPSQTDLNDALLAHVGEICGTECEEHIVRFMNLFYDVVAPFMRTPRHVTRLVNAISVTWPAVAEQVNRGDFLALETLRLYEPDLYRVIRSERDAITRTDRSERRTQDERFDPFLAGLAESRHDQIKVALQRLFPAFENTSYGDRFYDIWSNARRVCIDKHFDTYFRLSLSDETLSAADIAEVVEKAGDANFIKRRFADAALKRRKNGRTMVPILMGELTQAAKQVAEGDVTGLVCTLFEIADDIRIPGDKEAGFPSADAHLRLHWLIRRLTEDRFDLTARTTLYLSATENASPEWLVDFTASAVDDYKERPDAPQPDASCLTDASALPTLKARAIAGIRRLTESGDLLASDNPIYLLYRWRDWSADDGEEVKTWLASQMQSDVALVALAKALTGESWTAGLGFGGLGDRVSKRHLKASIPKGFDFFDLTEFRTGLERIVADEKLPEADLESVQVFLRSWNKPGSDDDD